MKRLCLVGVLVMAVAAANGGEKAKDKAVVKADKAVAAVPGVEMTLTGRVEKVEKDKKDGTPFMTWYQLVGEDGATTHLPKGKVEEFVGVKVKVVGMGEETKKKGKVSRKLDTITSIEKIEGDAQPAK